MFSDADLAERAKAIYSSPMPTFALRQEAQVFLWPYSPDEFLVGCPGTHVSDVGAWLRDLSAWPWWWRGVGALHEGFGSAAADLWPLIGPRLPRDRTVTFYGHSLGGAVAQILAGYFSAARPLQPFRIVTFGAPRVALFCNAALGPLLKRAAQATAYRRAGDIVPDVPAKPMYGHRMAGTQIGLAIDSLDPAVNHSIDLYIGDLDAIAAHQ